MSDNKINSRARRLELLLANLKLDSLPYIISSDAPALPSDYAIWIDADDGTISLQLVSGGTYLWYAVTVPFTQQQSDWAQADNTQVDFIKNKPVRFIRRSETFYAPSYISYLAFAPTGSLETDAVWTITKRVGSADGTIVSNVQSFNKKWTERGLL
jgi:hypothetical protein